MGKDSSISKEFEAVINRADETEVHAWLKTHPFIMMPLFGRSWNYYLVISEFSFGTDHKADFLVLSADSGSWNAAFIELKGPRDRIFLRDGTPSKKLRKAQKQIEDWKIFFRNRQEVVRQEMAKHLRKCSVSAQNALMGQEVSSAIEITHASTVIWDDYHILIGRRAEYLKEPPNTWAHRSGYQDTISTYDRILDWLRISEKNSRSELEQLLRCNSLDKACKNIVE